MIVTALSAFVLFAAVQCCSSSTSRTGSAPPLPTTARPPSARPAATPSTRDRPMTIGLRVR